MAYIRIKAAAQKQRERQTARDFGVKDGAENRELVECIAAKTEEAWRKMCKERSRYEN